MSALFLTIHDGTQPARIAKADTTMISSHEGMWVSFPIEPLTVLTGQRIVVTLASSLPRTARPLHSYMYANHERDDARPGGSLAVCRQDRCHPLEIRDSVAGPDLAMRMRYQTFPVSRTRELLLPMFAESFGMESVRGHLPFELVRVAAYLRELGEKNEGAKPENNRFLQNHRDMLDRFGIGFLLAAYEDADMLFGFTDATEALAFPVEERTGRLYRNTRAYPRVHLATRVFPASGELGTNVQTLRRGVLGRTEVLAEGVPFDTPKDFDPRARLAVRTLAPRELRLRVESPSEAFLVVRDVLFPGWNAFVDGVPTPIYPTDVVFRGVTLPPGGHEVVLTYQPQPWKTGARVSVLTASGIAAVSGAAIIQSRRRRQKDIPRLEMR
ncbi:MAG: hypothetical protein G01um1014106_524 [Parcubacteria group bacterium Gr01-1014_106]|nr:MAG: hypothetical protein G01um1014106_524 [Parcubacteria group bacterium Gr01-1014_106]